MVSLTTRQHDLLLYLLTANRPVTVAEVARHMQLTSRQVTYGLKNVKKWLAQHDLVLKSKTGVGIELNCTNAQKSQLLQELDDLSGVQLVLSAGQRQQLIALRLLTFSEPIILYQLQRETEVSRTTLLKDLDVIEAWAPTFELVLQRRPNYGFLLEGSEIATRQAITALLWGLETFGTPIMELSHLGGLQFTLARSAPLLTLVNRVNQLCKDWALDRPQSWVEYAERKLEAQFTDEASLHLALVLAVQSQRAQEGHRAKCPPAMVEQLKGTPVWEAAQRICQLMWLENTRADLCDETAFTAMHLISGSRNGIFNGDTAHTAKFSGLMDALMEQIAAEFGVEGLREDDALRQGLFTHIIPLFFRQQFGLWSPPERQTAVLSNEYAHEHAVAHELAVMISDHINTVLPAEELNNLALLLRAAYLRQQPLWPTKVIVVCPSGIATSQLLVARLKARFPRLSNVEILSVRELTHKNINAAQFIITTVPLPSLPDTIDIIRVHPLLKPEDIEQIRQRFA